MITTTIKLISNQMMRQAYRNCLTILLIEVQYLNKLSNSKLITIISDTSFSFVIEVNDDTAQTTNEAIGLATYSNSESTVLSYISIFETLWTQT
jgi:hypothetical protein